MPRILIVGGYGAFGSKAAERLAREHDLQLVIAGRSEPAAREAARHLADASGRKLEHAVVDATQATSEHLRSIAPNVVINASGPFQEQDYTLARACIGAGVHYIDLADARTFVTEIVDLDADARASGVLVVSGASSVPGLSSAVIDHFAQHFERLTEVSHGISPGNSFDPGMATTASVLGMVGRPVKMQVARRQETRVGWQGLSRHQFPGIGARWMGTCDVPDLELFPRRYPTLETVQFGAGVEVGAFHLGMWLLSWLVRIGIVKQPERLAAPLLAAKRRLSFLGSDTGGMFVTLRGTDYDGGAKSITWQLEAREGHGPYIPAMASVILAKKLARGQTHERGAMPCMGLFTLSEFMAEVADLAISSTDTETPLYQRVLGNSFDDLPVAVRRLHNVRGISIWSGEADVVRGTSPLARLGAWLTGLPPSGRNIPLTVVFEPIDGEESWVRTFGGHVFRSRQGATSGQLWETLGPVRLVFEPRASDHGLELPLNSVRIFGLPWPARMLPTAAAREYEENGKFRFLVDVRLPLGGRLVRYEGWLSPAMQPTAR